MIHKPNIGLVVTNLEGYSNGLDRDIDQLEDALAQSGLSVSRLIWHDSDVDWSAYDLVIIKSPWDYPSYYSEFMSWLDLVEQQTRVLNSPHLIRWNIDKVYLRELVDLGIPCLDFSFCSNLDEVKQAVKLFSASVQRVVIKPSVSAGSKDTALFDGNDPALFTLAESILAAEKTVMVMPEAKHVTSFGEHALYFFNGKYYYSFHKGPVLLPQGKYVGGVYTENITRGNPTPEEIQLGEQTIRILESVSRDHGFTDDAKLPLYARVDVGFDNDGKPKLIELELFEPALFADVVPESVDYYVQAVWERLPNSQLTLD